MGKDLGDFFALRGYFLLRVADGGSRLGWQVGDGLRATDGDDGLGWQVGDEQG